MSEFEALRPQPLPGWAVEWNTKGGRVHVRATWWWTCGAVWHRPSGAIRQQTPGGHWRRQARGVSGPATTYPAGQQHTTAPVNGKNSDHCHLESQTKRKCALPGSPSTCPPYRFRQPPTRSYAPNPRPGVVAQPDAKTPVRVMFSVTCNPDQGWCICRWVKGVWVGLAKDR